MSTLQEALEEEAREIRQELDGRKGAPAPRRLSQNFAMSSVYSGAKIRLPGDLGRGDPRRSSGLPGDLGPNDPRRRPATADASTKGSGARFSARSLSPATGSHSLSAGAAGPKMRRLSDAATRAPRNDNDITADGGVRLPKDFDNDSGSSDDDYEADNDASDGRGRQRTRIGNAVGLREDSEDSEDNERATSTAAAAAAEAKAAAAQDPTITVTPPTADMSHSRKSDVHPSTAFDFAASNTSTPVHSDDEENLDDLRRAQRLSLTVSPIHSTPSAHRVIRQVIRGDYGFFQREAEEGRRRQRVYLVATDLSSEAEYALEWTIGTVLRDGDTLLAVYAVNEEAGSGGGSEGVEIGHGADVVKDTASIVGSLAAQPVSPGVLPRDSSTARLAYGEREGMSKAEKERFRAAEAISQRCVKLLRKTRLQVRVVVEVFHCKSPRHMITEVIDFLSPTLTILGSRGRSNLKGVLLGSFSNYLVTKSSTPVMVARKRLRKHSKQRTHKDGLPMAQAGDGRMRYGRMSNILEAPIGSAKRGNRLEGAKID
ncbi:hypothetical protein MBLNU459_g1065t1 [Dothideomycetes sp. NU459]